MLDRQDDGKDEELGQAVLSYEQIAQGLHGVQLALWAVLRCVSQWLEKF